MIIDAHAHVGDFRWSKNDQRQPMTWEKLIVRLDDEGIDKDELFSQGQVSQATWDRINWHQGLMPQLDYLKALVREGRIAPEVFHKITWKNAAKLLGES
ncbi:MAG: hypothetical protein ACUVWR_01165 [Anaerolineae bacterium]